MDWCYLRRYGFLLATCMAGRSRTRSWGDWPILTKERHKLDSDYHWSRCSSSFLFLINETGIFKLLFLRGHKPGRTGLLSYLSYPLHLI